jgi:hypothetical protein
MGRPRPAELWWASRAEGRSADVTRAGGSETAVDYRRRQADRGTRHGGGRQPAACVLPPRARIQVEPSLPNDTGWKGILKISR